MPSAPPSVTGPGGGGAIPLLGSGPHSPEQLRRYLAEVRAAARAAGERTGSTEHHIVAGGHRLLVEVVSDRDGRDPVGLEAFEHEAAPSPTEPILQLIVWDARRSGDRIPRPPAPSSMAHPHRPARVLARLQRGSGVISVVDLDAGVGVVAWEAQDLPSWERAAPFVPVIHWALAAQGVQMVHGGAVEVDGGAVLVVGPGGSGKSTTCLAALGAGLGYLGDDYVGVEVGGSQPTIHRLFSTAKVDADQYARIPGLADAASPLIAASPGEKLVLSVRAGRSVRQASLRALVAPTAAGVATRGRPAISRITLSEAIRRLAPSTLSQLEGAGAGALGAMVAACAAVPCFELALPSDPALIAPLLHGLWTP